jgi:hypothetical protein
MNGKRGGAAFKWYWMKKEKRRFNEDMKCDEMKMR